MWRKAKQYVLLLLMILLVTSSFQQGIAEANDGKLVYEVTYATEDLSTPTAWYNSAYLNDPAYKENRFVQYWVETPITPGGPRDTGFYMVYRKDGLYIFFQSNEQEKDESNKWKNSSIELFVKYGQGDLPYHQMIFETNDSNVQYYEWQTDYRDNVHLKGNITLNNEELPSGWGSVLFIPWKAAYKYVPLNGEDWEFSMIRWSPSNSPTWGGKVHQVGRFNSLHFQEPTAAARTDIQKHVIGQAWEAFNEAILQLEATWLNGDADDASFYNIQLLPLIVQGQTNGSQIPNLDNLSGAEIEQLYEHIDSWFELSRDVEDKRGNYIINKLFGEGDEQPPLLSDLNVTVQKNTPASGTLVGTDPAGGTLSYSLGDVPSHGTAAVETDGSWTYTPNEHFTGNDLFKVVATNPSGASVTATVHLTITAGPVTVIALNPNEPNGSHGWYTSDVTVTLETTADSNPVDFTEYRINSGDWTVYEGSFVISADGVNTLEYRGVDSAGITEQAKQAAISIDQTAPTAAITYSITAPTHNSVTATLEPSESVTITNNGGSDSNTFLFNGNFTFEFVDAAGNPGSVTATVNNILSNSTGLPGKPILSDDNGQDNGLQDGTYNIKMNQWWGNNGRIYKLYENDSLIDTQILSDQAPEAQSAASSISGKPNGTYRYYVELTNAFGTTKSDVWTVTVSQAAPAKPILSSNNWDGNGNFDIQMNMWWGMNGTSYRLYENDVLVAEQTLVAGTPQAQSAVIEISGKPIGTYKYRIKLVNAAGATSSDTLMVKVTN